MNLIKIGKTTDPARRLLREARTWSPDELELIGAKPFWNIGKIEYSLHSALAEHWHRGEWHKFDEVHWMELFVDGFRVFKDDEDDRGANSVNFIYWMNGGTNYCEAVRMQCEHKMSLRAWRECHGYPWRRQLENQAPVTAG
jgi:hypothetical protein